MTTNDNIIWCLMDVEGIDRISGMEIDYWWAIPANGVQISTSCGAVGGILQHNVTPIFDGAKKLSSEDRLSS